MPMGGRIASVTPSHNFQRERGPYGRDRERLFFQRSREGFTLSQSLKLPLPMLLKSVNLSKEEDPLLEASWGNFSNEESPMGTTSRSTKDSWMEPPESLPPKPRVESETKA